jgi:hypothetical protein
MYDRALFIKYESGKMAVAIDNCNKPRFFNQKYEAYKNNPAVARLKLYDNPDTAEKIYSQIHTALHRHLAYLYVRIHGRILNLTRPHYIPKNFYVEERPGLELYMVPNRKIKNYEDISYMAGDECKEFPVPFRLSEITITKTNFKLRGKMPTAELCDKTDTKIFVFSDIIKKDFQPAKLEITLAEDPRLNHSSARFCLIDITYDGKQTDYIE